MSRLRRCDTPGRSGAWMCKRKVSSAANGATGAAPRCHRPHTCVAARTPQARSMAAAVQAAGPRTRGMPGSGVEQRPSASRGGASPSAPAGRMISGPPWLCTLTRNALRRHACARQRMIAKQPMNVARTRRGRTGLPWRGRSYAWRQAARGKRRAACCPRAARAAPRRARTESRRPPCRG